jgi:hypothetical protein
VYADNQLRNDPLTHSRTNLAALRKIGGPLMKREAKKRIPDYSDERSAGAAASAFAFAVQRPGAIQASGDWGD